MKITGEVKSRGHFADAALRNIIEFVVSFVVNEKDGFEYTPYFKGEGLKIAVALYGVDGVEFDENDDISYEIDSTPEIYKAVYAFIEENGIRINDFVDDIVEHRKQEYYHRLDNALAERLALALKKEEILNDLLVEIAENQNKILKQQIVVNEYQEEVMKQMTPDEVAALNKKISSGELNIDHVVDNTVEKFIKSDYHDNNTKKVIDGLKAEIVDLLKYKKMYEARNVLNDDGK